MENPGSDCELWQLTDGAVNGRASVRSYFDFCPWSPDAQKIAFLSHDESRTGMTVCWIDENSGEVHEVANVSRFDSHDALRLQWLSDGSSLIYDQGQAFGVINISTGSYGEFCGALQAIDPMGGRVLVFSVWRQKPSVPPRGKDGAVMIDLATGKKSLMISLADIIEAHPQKKRIHDFKLNITHGKWTPDGKRILFVLTNKHLGNSGANHGDSLKTLFTVNADGTGLRAHTTSPSHMTWHPDGRRVLTNTRNAGEKILALIDAETGKTETVCAPHPGSGGGSHPSFSPDGKYILFEKFSALSGRQGIRLCELLMLDVSQGKMKRLALFPVMNYSHAGIHVHPSWSPDGKSILYHSDQTGRSELYLLHVF